MYRSMGGGRMTETLTVDELHAALRALPRKRARPEQKLQVAVAGYLSWALSAPWTAMPAGGGGRIRGAALRGMGLKPGWPDIQIIGPDGRYHGLELKAPKTGAVSAAQVQCHDEMIAAGGRVAIVRNLDEMRAALESWGIPLRAESIQTSAIRRVFAEVTA